MATKVSFESTNWRYGNFISTIPPHITCAECANYLATKGPYAPGEFLFILQKYLSSVPFCKCERRFWSYQNFVKPYQTSKPPSSCPREGQIFVKRQNCQILQFASFKMAENVNQRNLISLFRVYTFSRSPYLWLSNILVFLANSKFVEIFVSQTNLFNLVRKGPKLVETALPIGGRSKNLTVMRWRSPPSLEFGHFTFLFCRWWKKKYLNLR